MTRSVIAVSDADAYFLTTPRNADWTAVTDKQIQLNESQRWLNGLCYDETRDCCGRSFGAAWVEAVSELALALSMNPTAIISGSAAATGTQGAIKEQALGELKQSFYDVKDGQVSTSKYGPQSPKVLQAFPFVGEIIGCWLNVATGSARIISRCC